MKFIPSQLAYLTTDREARTNLRALGKYLLFLAALVALYTVLFHVIKLNVEHEQHSWVTGLYWTLVVMIDARVRRHHVHQRHRPRLQHHRAAVGRRVPAGDAAVPVHPAVLRAVARGARAAARAEGSARRARSGHVIIAEYDADRRRAHRAAGRRDASPTSSSSRTRAAPGSCSATASRCWPARTTTGSPTSAPRRRGRGWSSPTARTPPTPTSR